MPQISQRSTFIARCYAREVSRKLPGPWMVYAGKEKFSETKKKKKKILSHDVVHLLIHPAFNALLRRI